MKTFLEAGAGALAKARQLAAAATESPAAFTHALCSVTSITYWPVIPDSNKFLCVGKNYRTHLEELKRTDLIKEIPQEPTGFIKTNECLSGHEATVKRPATVSHLDYEPELVFVMSKRAFELKKTDTGFNAMDYVIGVTVLTKLLILTICG